MTRLRSHAGFTLVEVLLVCTISTIVFGATLTAFAQLSTANRRAEVQHDNVENARVALDRAARQLRNLANPTVNATTTIDRATDYDLIFQTSDPAKTWVRYCLDKSGGGSPTDGWLWQAESPGATLSGSMRGACPGTGWASARVVAQHVTNNAPGVDNRIFSFACAPGMPATCPATTAEYTRITSVGVDLYVDANVQDNSKPMQVSSAIFLRNQNESPTASATWSPTGTSRKVLLNGSGSSDPEGRSMEYFWFKGAPPAASELADCNVKPPSSIWEGVTLTYEFPAAAGAAGTIVPFYLVVRDPGCLTASFGPMEVTIPS